MTPTVLAEHPKSRIGQGPSWELPRQVGTGARAASRAVAEPANALLPGLPASLRLPLLRSRFRSLHAALAAWLSHCADRYADAAAYEELSRLSDTQLMHRGLSRDTLARDLSGR